MKVLPHVGVSPIDDKSDGVITSKSAECCFSVKSPALAPQGLGASTGGQIFDFRRDWPQSEADWICLQGLALASKVLAFILLF